MIEIINTGLAAFHMALVIYSFFTKRLWIHLTIIPLTILLLAYFIGYNLGIGEFIPAILSFLVVLIFTGTIIWRMKFSKEKQEPTYSREELIKAQHTYHRNFLAEPENFHPGPDGTVEEAEITIDYLIGIIDHHREGIYQHSIITGSKT